MVIVFAASVHPLKWFDLGVTNAFGGPSFLPDAILTRRNNGCCRGT
jgi:hypothetical protein